MTPELHVLVIRSGLGHTKENNSPLSWLGGIQPHPVAGEGDPPPEGPQPPPPPPVPPTPPSGAQDQEALQQAGSGILQEAGGGTHQQAGGGASQDDVRERGRGDKRGGGRPAMVTRCLRLCRLCLGWCPSLLLLLSSSSAAAKCILPFCVCIVISPYELRTLSFLFIYL